ncbi:hypothetical protein ISCGN_003037 [Ixodes scapularis]
MREQTTSAGGSPSPPARERPGRSNRPIRALDLPYGCTARGSSNTRQAWLERKKCDFHHVFFFFFFFLRLYFLDYQAPRISVEKADHRTCPCSSLFQLLGAVHFAQVDDSFALTASVLKLYSVSPYDVQQERLQARAPCFRAHLGGTSSRAIRAAAYAVSSRF